VVEHPNGQRLAAELDLLAGRDPQGHVFGWPVDERGGVRILPQPAEQYPLLKCELRAGWEVLLVDATVQALLPGQGGPHASLAVAGHGCPRIVALDFFTTDLLNGAKTCVLAVIEHGTRCVRVLGAIEHPAQAWVVQQARKLLMDLEDAGTRVKFVLHERDASFTAAFNAVFRVAGVRVIRSAVQAPRMNSVMERWIGSCWRELLDWILVWNQRHLMIVIREYEDFCNTHRPHGTLKQVAPLRRIPDGVTDLDHFRVQRRDRAGGAIHEYRLVA
jgi:hypothetical protein